MKKTLQNIVLVLFFSLTIKSLYAQQNKYKLTVTVHGIENINGCLDIALYNNARNFPEETGVYMSKSILVNRKVVKCVFYITQGIYAIALYHDENNNNKCDRNFMGIPKEGFAFSNNVKPYISAPSFNSCKFYVSKNTDISITLLHY